MLFGKSLFFVSWPLVTICYIYFQYLNIKQVKGYQQEVKCCYSENHFLILLPRVTIIICYIFIFIFNI